MPCCRAEGVFEAVVAARGLILLLVLRGATSSSRPVEFRCPKCKERVCGMRSASTPARSSPARALGPEDCKHFPPFVGYLFRGFPGLGALVSVEQVPEPDGWGTYHEVIYTTCGSRFGLSNLMDMSTACTSRRIHLHFVEV